MTWITIILISLLYVMTLMVIIYISFLCCEKLLYLDKPSLSSPYCIWVTIICGLFYRIISPWISATMYSFVLIFCSYNSVVWLVDSFITFDFPFLYHVNADFFLLSNPPCIIPLQYPPTCWFTIGRFLHAKLMKYWFINIKFKGYCEQHN